MTCGACSSNASTIAGFATSTTWNSVSSRSGVASTRTSLTKQFGSGVFDYAHVYVQTAATLSTNCNWCYCVRTANSTFPYWKLLFSSSIFKQLLLRNRVVDFVEICNICARKAIIKAAKRVFNSDKTCRSYCDFYFGILFWNTVYNNFIVPVGSNGLLSIGLPYRVDARCFAAMMWESSAKCMTSLS